MQSSGVLQYKLRYYSLVRQIQYSVFLVEFEAFNEARIDRESFEARFHKLANEPLILSEQQRDFYKECLINFNILRKYKSSRLQPYNFLEIIVRIGFPGIRTRFAKL